MTVIQAATSQRAACLRLLACFSFGIPDQHQAWARERAIDPTNSIRINKNDDYSNGTDTHTQNTWRVDCV